jgi:hypothetical protein
VTEGRLSNRSNDFLFPPENADPDIPIVNEAKAEYAKLQ